MCRNFLFWWGPNSSFLLLFLLPLETCWVRSCCGLDQRGFAAFSLRILMASCLTFVFHLFWVYFCVWFKKVVQVHFSACCCPVFPVPLAEKTDLFHCVFIPVLSNISCHMLVGPFLGSVFCYIDLSVLVTVPYYLDDYSFVIQLEVWDYDTSSFGFLFQDCFGYSGSFLIPCKF